jgi:hypothetical protein
MTDPLACPFCGSRNVAHGLFGGDMIVKCIGCFSGGPPVEAPEFSDMVEKREQAVAAWNRRPEPSKPVAEAVKVKPKPLEWKPNATDTFCRACWFAAHPYGGYHIYERDTNGKGRIRYFTSPIAALTEYSSLEDAKAAAQADYEQRIMSALSTHPQLGEDERSNLRRRIYRVLANEGGGTWATYVCIDIGALERAAFEAGKSTPPQQERGI